jgi:hypothetical protein
MGEPSGHHKLQCPRHADRAQAVAAPQTHLNDHRRLPVVNLWCPFLRRPQGGCEPLSLAGTAVLGSISRAIYRSKARRSRAIPSTSVARDLRSGLPHRHGLGTYSWWWWSRSSTLSFPVGNRPPQPRTCIEQRADDRSIVSRTITVDHAPRGLTERRPRTFLASNGAPRLRSSLTVSSCRPITAQCRPVWLFLTRAQVNTAVQQELDDLISAAPRPAKARLHLRLGGVCQAATVVEKGLDHIERPTPAAPSRSIGARAAKIPPLRDARYGARPSGRFCRCRRLPRRARSRRNPAAFALMESARLFELYAHWWQLRPMSCPVQRDRRASSVRRRRRRHQEEVSRRQRRSLVSSDESPRRHTPRRTAAASLDARAATGLISAPPGRPKGRSTSPRLRR